MSQRRRERRKLLREIQKIDPSKKSIQHLLTQADGEELRRRYMQKIKNEEIKSKESPSDESNEISFGSGTDYSELQNLILKKNWESES
jgi:hypothetical protein